MPRKPSSSPDLEVLPMLAHETLYVGVDVGKRAHVAGFLSSTLLTRHQRFEHCPALAFDNSREGFRSLIDRIKTYVPLTQVQALLEVTGHYHRALLQYLQEVDIPVYVIHVQKRQEGLLKTDKRDALGLANLLYNQLEKGIQVGDPLQAVRRLVSPTEAVASLRGMVHHHYELIAESTQRKNKLTAICDELFPEFTRLLRNPNLPTALALRSRFPTPAALAEASFWELREVRGRTCSVSDAKLVELQRLAGQSIGTKDPARVRGLVFEQKQLIADAPLVNRCVGDAQLAGHLCDWLAAGLRQSHRFALKLDGIGLLNLRHDLFPPLRVVYSKLLLLYTFGARSQALFRGAALQYTRLTS